MTYEKLSRSLCEQLRMTHEITYECWQHNTANHPKFKLPSTTSHGLVLEHGVSRYCTTNKLPRDVRKGRVKDCFRNSTRLMLSNPDRYIYCEGFGVRGALGFVIGEHAWCLDRENDYAVVDITWRDCSPGAYLGIPFNYRFVSDMLLKTNYYGLLDNPKYWSKKWWDDEYDYLHPEASQIKEEFAHEC